MKLRGPILGVSVFAALTLVLHAHHIMGVPHYAYDELYPQTPVLTYKANLQNYRIEMTANPGKPAASLTNSTPTGKRSMTPWASAA